MPVEDRDAHDDYDYDYDYDNKDPFEDRLGTAVRRAAGAFEADSGALAAAGAVRGRRLLLRRRAAVVGGVAAVALVGVGGTLLVPWGGDGSGQASVAAGRPTVPPPAEGDGTYSAADLVRTLKKLLPKGEFSEEQGRGTDSKPTPYAQVVYDDGKGGGAVSVGLGRIEADSQQAREATHCPGKVQLAYDSCKESKLADGSALMLFQGYEYPDQRVDTKWWSAELVTPQGQHISVSEWNAPAEKDAPVTRDNPPLTVAELKHVATAAAWRKAVDAIPDRPRAAQTDPAVPSGADGADGAAIGRTLAALLPKGLKVTAKGGQESEYAYVVVDDGKGGGMVEVNVQSGMGDLLAGHMEGAEELSDGTLVLSTEAPDEKGRAGVVVRTVDVLRPNGDRVVIMASNAAALHGGATREAPVLTLGRLKKIATSGQWDEIR